VGDAGFAHRVGSVTKFDEPIGPKSASAWMQVVSSERAENARWPSGTRYGALPASMTSEAPAMIVRTEASERFPHRQRVVEGRREGSDVVDEGVGRDRSAGGPQQLVRNRLASSSKHPNVSGSTLRRDSCVLPRPVTMAWTN
jgi:hypothetical protein